MENYESETEFNKLDSIDRKVVIWIQTFHESALRSWVEYVSHDYRRYKAIHIDADKLMAELMRRQD